MIAMSPRPATAELERHRAAGSTSTPGWPSSSSAIGPGRAAARSSGSRCRACGPVLLPLRVRPRRDRGLGAHGLPTPERMRALRDPDGSVRRLEPSGRGTEHAPPGGVEAVIVETFARRRPYEGRRIAEIAARSRKAPFDALLDIVVADGLHTSFRNAADADTPEDWTARLAVARSACGDRCVRRGRAPRHDRHLPLLDRLPPGAVREHRLQSTKPFIGSLAPPLSSTACATGVYSGRRARRCCRARRHTWRSDASPRGSISRAAPAVSTPRRAASTTCSSAGPRSRRVASTPASGRGGYFAPVSTRRRRRWRCR